MRSDLPLVSVCLPVYNGAQFIEGAIASILHTTYPHLEVIVSDDDSTDQTVELIQAANVPNLKLLTHSRYGLVENWNYCLSQAQGKYIKFLFQDDLLAPNCIEMMVAAAEQNDSIGLVFSPRYLIYETKVQSQHFPEILHSGWSHLKSVQTGLSLFADPKLFQHPHNKIGEPTCTLIRQSVLEQVGTFDPAFQQYVDLEMWYRIMSYYEIAFINEPLASFRLHAHQQTQANRIERTTWLEIYQVWKKVLTHASYDRIPVATRQKLKRLFWQQVGLDLIKKMIKFQFGRAIALLKTVSQ